MKQIEQSFKDEIRNEKQVEIDKTVRYIGNMKYFPGHSVFEYNPVDGYLRKIEYEKEVIADAKGHRFKRKIKTTEGCMYVQALNMKNAKKKILKTIDNINKLSHDPEGKR